MATSRPFAYNTGSSIPGTDQVGDIAAGTPYSSFEDTGLEWWNGPDEELGYVVCLPVPGETQDSPVWMNWDSNYVGSGNTLLNDKRSIRNDGSSYTSVIGASVIPNKVMYSIQVDEIIGLNSNSIPLISSVIGIGKRDMNTSSYVGGSDSKSVGFTTDGNVLFAGTTIYTGLPTWGSLGDVVDIAIDPDPIHSGLWIRVNNGYWNGDQYADPYLNTGGKPSPLSLTNTYAAMTVYTVGVPGSFCQISLLDNPVYSIPNEFIYMKNYGAVKFIRSNDLTEGSFVDLVNSHFNQNYSTGNSANTYLTTHGYWSSWSGFGSSGFQWMNVLTIGPTTASGIGQNNITILINQSGGGMATNNGMYSAATFPEQYGVPLTGNQIQNHNNGTFTAVFSQSVLNPLVAFASVGNSSLSVPVIVSVPFTPIWGQNTTYQNPVGTQSQYTQFTGTEGFNIIRIDGTVSSVSFNYTVAESYSTICFGFVDQNV